MKENIDNTENTNENVTNLRSKEYLYQFSEITDNFEVIDKIGEGSFAVVFSVKSKTMENLKERFALKFTIPTIDPKRIENELRILKKIGGRNNVVKLHLSFRVKDHIFMIMPLIDHQKFVDYYLNMDMKEIREYIRNLLIALMHIHKNKIIHRDVKPNNFLYDRHRKKFTLVDFGLAHSETYGDLGSWFDKEEFSKIGNDKISISRMNSSNNNKNPKCGSLKSRLSESSNLNDVISCNNSCICGNRLTTCSDCRSKPRLQVRREGTIGYRPPEVMMRHDEQTTSIDVWAVGIILGIFLTGNYPFMRAEDDFDVFHGLIYLLSLEKMQFAALDINRQIVVNPKPKPVIGDYVLWLKGRCCRLRKHCSKIVKLSKDPKGSIVSCIYGNDHVFDDSMYDLLSRLLDPAYRTRYTCAEALQHEFFRTSH